MCKFYLFLYVSILGAVAFSFDLPDALLLIQTRNGWVRGQKAYTIPENNPYYAYRGVPFAKPPIGNLRFEAPQPVENWSGIRDATKERDICPQYFQLTVKTNQIVGSEDCLYLNIYTPISPLDVHSQKSRAVMVWIYGGGFYEGENTYSIYAPDRLLDEDVVVVALAYRLGIFGGFATDDLVGPGNNALRDQILALKWIKDNIKAFGGDPQRITIWGQSAGAASISFLTQTPLTKGLYHRVILQSGSSYCPWAFSGTSSPVTYSTAALLGINATSSLDLKNKLKAVNYKLLLTMGTTAISRLYGSFPLGGIPLAPMLEPKHPGAVVTKNPFETLTSGEFNLTPIMIGFASMEIVDFPLYAGYRAYLDIIGLASEYMVPSTFNITNTTILKEVGDQLKLYYFGDLSAVTFTDEQFIRFYTAALFITCSIETAQIAARFTDVFMYQLSYLGELGNPLRPYDYGVGHSEDLNYLFRRITSPPTIPAADRLTSRRIVRLWTNFAKTGNPTPANDPLLQNVRWPKIDENLNYLDINVDLVVGVNPKEEEYNFWMDLLARYRNAD